MVRAPTLERRTKMKHILDDQEFNLFMRLRSEHRAKKQVSRVLSEMHRVLKLWAGYAKNEAKCRAEAEAIQEMGEELATRIKEHYENVAAFIENASKDIEKTWAAYIAADGKENE